MANINSYMLDESLSQMVGIDSKYFDVKQEPQLRPDDLEELSIILDKIRNIKKKIEPQSQPKRFIAKNTTPDVLGQEFQAKLSEISLKLSLSLQNNLISRT